MPIHKARLKTLHLSRHYFVNIQCIGNVVTKKTGSKYYYLFTTGSAVSHSGQAYFNSFNVTEHSSYSIDSGDLQPGISINLTEMNVKIYDGSETMNEVTDFTNKYIEVYQVSKYTETTHQGSGNVQGSGGLETDYYVDFDLIGRQEISTVDNLPTTPDSRFIVL